MAEINTVITEASQDLQTIEDFVNLPADSEVYPRLLPSVNVGTLAGIRDAIFEAGGLPATPFKTKSAMEVSDLVDGSYAQVTDSTVDVNGLYYKEQGVWVKSQYSPDMQSSAKADGVLIKRLGGVVNLDTTANTLNFTGDIVVNAAGRIYNLTTPQTVNIPFNASQRVVFNESTETLQLYNTTSDLPAGMHYVGSVSRSAAGLEVIGFDYLTDSTNTSVLTKPRLKAMNYTPDVVIITYHGTPRLTISTEFRLTSSTQTYLVPPQIVDLPTANMAYRVEYNIKSKSIVFTPAQTTTSPVYIIEFAYLIKSSTGYELLGIDKYKKGDYGTEEVNSAKKSFVGLLATYANGIDFRFYDKKIAIKGDAVRLQYDNTSKLLPEFSVDIASDPRWQGLAYSPVLNTMTAKVVNLGLTGDEIWLAFFHTDTQQVSGIDNFSINGIAKSSLANNWVEQQYKVISGDFDANYKQEQLTSWASWVAANTSHTSVYALYDSLVSTYPDYITKTELGKDALGNSLYQYDFKPFVPSSSNMGSHLPKVVLFSGVHGAEKAGVICLYNALKQICDNWANDTKLEALRYNCHFIVVPVAVPSGFNNSSRKNHAGVDIARNFSSGWKLQHEPSHQYYGGAVPLDQAETVILDSVLKDNKDAIFFGSSHNFGQQISDGYDFIWVASGSQLQANLGKNMLERRRREWIKSGIIDSTVTSIGFASNDLPMYGNESSQAKYYGIMGGVMEVCSVFWWGSDKNINYSATAVTLGTEAWVNWLLLNVDYGCRAYNSRFSI